MKHVKEDWKWSKEILPYLVPGHPYKVKYWGKTIEGNYYYKYVYDALISAGMQYGKRWIRNKQRECDLYDEN